MLTRCAVILGLIFSSAAVHGEDATAVFARFKSASGGARWDMVSTVRATGGLSAGGLSGILRTTTDVQAGRSSAQYTLGPIEGANGYDGKVAWTRTPGGEVAVQDGPEARRGARRQAWLDTLAYWYPDRLGALYTPAVIREENGKRYHVVVATPDGGDPVTLWFSAESHLLLRTMHPDGADTTTTVFADYREVNGVRLPFHVVSDTADSQGRIDPRRHTETRWERIVLNEPIADSDFAVPTMVETSRITDPGGTAVVPFDLVNNHIYVDGHVNGKAVRLLVDTGGVNVLTPAVARRLGLKSEGKLAAKGVGEQASDFGLARAVEVRIGAALLARPVFYVLDLGGTDRTTGLDDIEGVPIDGLIGYEMFRRFGVRIDYANRTLTFTDPARFVPPAGATVLPFQLDDRMPIVEGELDGIAARISIDTGQRTSLTVHAPFVREHELVARYRATPESVVGWGVGGPVRGRPVRFGSLRLGDLRITGLAGDLFTRTEGAFANPNISANLGGGALRQFTVGLDYANKRLYLAPNAELGRPDPFDRSGLWLALDRGALKVLDVAADSGAQRAGLQVGDRIVSIDGKSVDSRKLADWRHELRVQPAGTRLKIGVERRGVTHYATLALADRIPTSFELGAQ
jgi:hypothetical protein